MEKDTLFIGMDLGTYKTSVASSSGLRDVLVSAVGWPKDHIARTMLGRDVVFGKDIVEHRLALNIIRPFEKGMLLRFALAANVLLGVEWNLSPNVVAPAGYPADVRFRDPPDGLLPTGSLPPVSDFRAALSWLDETKDLTPTNPGAWRWTHRESIPLRVRVTNAGSHADAKSSRV